jgi:hypothetical protein
LKKVFLLDNLAVDGALDLQVDAQQILRVILLLYILKFAEIYFLFIEIML